jgi:hypothetical protein
MACSDTYEFCGQMTFDGNVTVSILRRALRKYNVKLKGNWDIKHAASVYHSVGTVGAKFASERGGGESASEAFRAVYDHMTILWEGGAGMCGNVAAACGGCTDGAHQIRFWSMSGQTQNDLPRMVKNVIHELGHAYDWTQYNPNDRTRASNHMSPDFTRNMVLRPNEYAGRPDWQQSAETTSSEIFADMFIAWTYNAWNTSTDPLNVAVVTGAQNWMNGLVP